MIARGFPEFNSCTTFIIHFVCGAQIWLFTAMLVTFTDTIITQALPNQLALGVFRFSTCMTLCGCFWNSWEEPWAVLRSLLWLGGP